jgi:N-acetylmuramoyl-L-alanine amidase
MAGAASMIRCGIPARIWVSAFIAALIWSLAGDGAQEAFSKNVGTAKKRLVAQSNQATPAKRNPKGRPRGRVKQQEKVNVRRAEGKKRKPKHSKRKQASKALRPLIVLDAGHGGKDPGAMAGGLVEKDITLQLALLLRRELRRMGFKIVLTRDHDMELRLSDRVRRAAALHPNLFVSLHCNASLSPESQGIETFAYLPARLRPGKKRLIPLADAPDIVTRSSRMAKIIHKGLMRGLASWGWRDGGPRLGRFAVLTLPDCPCLLLEMGYLTNKSDAYRLRSVAARRRMAAVLAKTLAGQLSPGANVQGP